MSYSDQIAMRRVTEWGMVEFGGETCWPSLPDLGGDDALTWLAYTLSAVQSSWMPDFQPRGMSMLASSTRNLS